MNCEKIYYNSIDSTNDEMKRLVNCGKAEEGLVIYAGRQTKGRGRRGREWHSPDNGSLYMSLLVRPDFDVDKASMLTLLMAYSVAEVLNKGEMKVQIKWPNDLVISGKKVCGILTELHWSNEGKPHVIIGLGINLSLEKLPAEIEKLAIGITMDRDEIIQTVRDAFFSRYEKFKNQGNLEFIKERYNQLLINCNREVKVHEPGAAYQGIALGIAENGNLLVRTEDGCIQQVYAGEVSVRGIDGYV